MCFAKQRDFDVYNYAGKTEVTTNKNRWNFILSCKEIGYHWMLIIASTHVLHHWKPHILSYVIQGTMNENYVSIS